MVLAVPLVYSLRDAPGLLLPVLLDHPAGRDRGLTPRWGCGIILVRRYPALIDSNRAIASEFASQVRQDITADILEFGTFEQAPDASSGLSPGA